MSEHLVQDESMETLLYEHIPGQLNSNPRYDKSNLNLRLEAHNNTTGPVNMKGLPSPDFGLLKLTSPDLERLIMGQANALEGKSSEQVNENFLLSPDFEKLLTTVHNQIHRPVNVNQSDALNPSQQREVYVQGFVDALQQIHDQQETQTQHYHEEIEPQVPQEASYQHVAQQQTQLVNPYPVHEQRFQEEISYNIPRDESAQFYHQLNTHNFSSVGNSHPDHEPQSFTLPDQSKSSLPLPPIDLEMQEIVKRERKKQKNRVAASKCRKRKLEREAQLEIRVQHLKDKSLELLAIANSLRLQVSTLKQKIVEHMAAGCQIPEMMVEYYNN